AWIDSSGAKHSMAVLNSWAESAWFFPALSLLSQATQPNIVFSYVGTETVNNLSAYHLRSTRRFPVSNTPNQDFFQRISATDFYIDSASLLPLGIAYVLHPDNDSNVNIRAEIRFADYRSTSGIQVPFHIQQLINDGLALDLTVSSVAINAGIPSTLFNVQ